MKKFLFALIFMMSASLSHAYTLNGVVIPDYTDVGYKRGTEAIPQYPATISYPAGIFTLDKKIMLYPKQVLRGAGKDKTFLYFPKGLVGMGRPCSESIDKMDCWDWDGGVIDIVDGRMTGVENLTIVFPEHPYVHHKGQGFNGIKCGNCVNTWIKNVDIKHADVGVNYIGGHHNTIMNLTFTANPSKSGGSHSALQYTGTRDNLARNIQMYGQTFHGLTGNWGASRNVFSNIYGNPVKAEPNHGGPTSMSFLYSRAEGTSATINQGNNYNLGGALFWNYGNKKSTPLDVYEAQMRDRGLNPDK